MTNFEAAENAMAKMEDSAGNADAEMSIITESLEYKLNALSQTGVGIWQNLFPREDIGNAIDILTKLAGAVDKFTEKAGLLGTIGAGAGIIGLIRNFGKLFALYSRKAVLHKPSNCGEALTPLCYNVALTGKRESRRKAERNSGWPMLNNNAKGHITMSNPQPSPSPLSGLYRVGICDKREGSQTVRGFSNLE